MPIYFFSVWAHILAAAAWSGGAIFLALVLVPSLRKSRLEVRPIDIIREMGGRFLWLGWGCLVLLVGTGVLNLHYRGVEWEMMLGETFWHQPFGKLLAWKLALMSVVLILSLGHDFFLGPYVARRFQTDPVSPQLRRFRVAARWVGRINLVLGLLMVGLGVAMVRGWPFHPGK